MKKLEYYQMKIENFNIPPIEKCVIELKETMGMFNSAPVPSSFGGAHTKLNEHFEVCVLKGNNLVEWLKSSIASLNSCEERLEVAITALPKTAIPVRKHRVSDKAKNS